MSKNFANLKQDKLDSSERQQYVTRLFDELAPRYDRFNRFVSFKRDEAWRTRAIELLQERAGGVILDLAAGTGDLANSAMHHGAQQVHVFDISSEMLQFAKRKLVPSNGAAAPVAFTQGSAHLLPFQDKSIDGVVSGFAMRNVFHFLDQVLAEMQRVLKPGGRIAILELSRPGNTLVRLGFELHLKTIMPLIGRLATGVSTPFGYLRQTTMTFLTADEFKQRLEQAGFAGVGWETYLFGGIAIHFGVKQP